MTPAQLRALANEADAQAEKLASRLDRITEAFSQRISIAKGQADLLRELADKAEGILTNRTERTNIRHKMQLQQTNGRKVGRPIESEHAFPAWLRSLNITITEWAASHVDPDTGKPYKRERVKSWFADGAGARPAPRRAVDEIEKESTDAKTKKCAVPATKRTWKNGIRE